MTNLNKILTLSSINVLLVTVERFSFTTKILFEPYGFIRLHELLQGPVFLTIAIVLNFFIFREVSNNFSAIKTKIGLWLGALFTAGVYLYGLGEGWHEVASFTFNQHCDVKNFVGNLCGGLFINDYYTGNILFFKGAVAMSLALLLLEKMNLSKAYNGKALLILLINSVVYAFTFFAYAGFDRVLVGLYSTAILMIIADLIFWSVRKKWRQYPYLTYSAFAYTLATIASLIVRFH